MDLPELFANMLFDNIDKNIKKAFYIIQLARENLTEEQYIEYEYIYYSKCIDNINNELGIEDGNSRF